MKPLHATGAFLMDSWRSHNSSYARRRDDADGQRQHKIPERHASARRRVEGRARRADAPGVRHTPQHDAVGPARQARPVHLARVPPHAVQERRPRARDAAREHDGPDVERPAEVEAADGEVPRGAVDGARRAVVARCPRDDVPACVEIKILRRVRHSLISTRVPTSHRLVAVGLHDGRRRGVGLEAAPRAARTRPAVGPADARVAGLDVP